eukprot:Rhum_TRINITY_DN4265_c0_g1::Rhum_TRINITY_DN4265_c0_g1_i1::g.13669::m.13669
MPKKVSSRSLSLSLAQSHSPLFFFSSFPLFLLHVNLKISLRLPANGLHCACRRRGVCLPLVGGPGDVCGDAACRVVRLVGALKRTHLTHLLDLLVEGVPALVEVVLVQVRVRVLLHGAELDAHEHKRDKHAELAQDNRLPRVLVAHLVRKEEVADNRLEVQVRHHNRVQGPELLQPRKVSRNLAVGSGRAAQLLEGPHDGGEDDKAAEERQAGKKILQLHQLKLRAAGAVLVDDDGYDAHRELEGDDAHQHLLVTVGQVRLEERPAAPDKHHEREDKRALEDGEDVVHRVVQRRHVAVVPVVVVPQPLKQQGCRLQHERQCHEEVDLVQVHLVLLHPVRPLQQEHEEHKRQRHVELRENSVANLQEGVSVLLRDDHLQVRVRRHLHAALVEHKRPVARRGDAHLPRVRRDLRHVCRNLQSLRPPRGTGVGHTRLGRTLRARPLAPERSDVGARVLVPRHRAVDRRADRARPPVLVPVAALQRRAQHLLMLRRAVGGHGGGRVCRGRVRGTRGGRFRGGGRGVSGGGWGGLGEADAQGVVQGLPVEHVDEDVFAALHGVVRGTEVVVVLQVHDAAVDAEQREADAGRDGAGDAGQHLRLQSRLRGVRDGDLARAQLPVPEHTKLHVTPLGGVRQEQVPAERRL